MDSGISDTKLDKIKEEALKKLIFEEEPELIEQPYWHKFLKFKHETRHIK